MQEICSVPTTNSISLKLTHTSGIHCEAGKKLGKMRVRRDCRLYFEFGPQPYISSDAEILLCTENLLVVCFPFDIFGIMEAFWEGNK